MQSVNRNILERKGGIKDLLIRSMDVVEQWVDEQAEEVRLRGRNHRKHSLPTTTDSSKLSLHTTTYSTSASPASNIGVAAYSKYQELDEEPDSGIFWAMNRGNAISVEEFSKSKDASIVDVTIPESENLQTTIKSGDKTTELGSSSLMAENRFYETELHLDRLYNGAVEHEFYCPNCKSCIRKVIVRELESNSAPNFERNDDTFRCLSCFSFLIPAENWFFRNSVPDEERRRFEQDTNITRQSSDTDSDDVLGNVQTDNEISQKIKHDERLKIQPNGKKNVKAEGSDEDDDRLPQSSSILIPDDDEDEQTTITQFEPRDGKKWDIIKSVVYGGLNQSITSLGVVTSAASSDTSTLNILAMTLANLIGGLFVIGHNLRDLKNEQPGNNNEQTNERTDHYEELLGNRQNHILHATVSILSFFVFGLVPPIVYAFSFRKSDNKDYKLAAVDGASLLCISMLAICKSYVRRHSKYYIRTVLYHVIAGIMASGFAYLTGEVVKSLLEKSGWFKLEMPFSGPSGEMNSGRSVAWASY